MTGLACLSVLASRMPMEVFERFAVRRDELDDALLRLRTATGADQLMLLSTCERVELYTIGAREPAEDVLADAVSDGGRRLAAEHLGPGSALLRGDAAAEHLLRVTAGLESSVLGDRDVVAQVRSAGAAARSRGVTGSDLDRLVATAVHASRRVRSTTALDEAGRSVAATAVRVAAERNSRWGAAAGTAGPSGLSGLSVVVVGAGSVAATVVQEAIARGARVTVCNRTRRHAQRYAAAGATVVDLARLAETVAAADVAVFGTASPHRLFGPGELPPTPVRDLLVLDLGVPRNVDPALRAVPGVVLQDLADLREAASEPSAKLLADVARTEQILTEELDRYRRWLRGRSAAASQRRLESERLAPVAAGQQPWSSVPSRRASLPSRRACATSG